MKPNHNGVGDRRGQRAEPRPRTKPPHGTTARKGGPTLDLPLIRCPECTRLFRRSRTDRRFCEPECRRRFHRRKEIRAGQSYEALVKWRISRGKEGAIGDVAHIVDQWIAEDRAAGRELF